MNSDPKGKSLEFTISKSDDIIKFLALKIHNVPLSLELYSRLVIECWVFL